MAIQTGIGIVDNKKKKLVADTSQILPTVTRINNPYNVQGVVKPTPTTQQLTTQKSTTQQPVSQPLPNQSKSVTPVDIKNAIVSNMPSTDVQQSDDVQQATQQLQQAQQQSQQQGVAPVQSNEDFIRQSYASENQALVNALKQRIAESVAEQQRQIAGAGASYDPLRAESEIRKSQELRSALERSSVLGDRGGIGRSEALATQTAGENRLTNINLQQQQFIDNANAEIARLQNEGRYEEAQILANQRASELRDILSERTRVQGVEEQRRTAEEERQFTLSRDRAQALSQRERDVLLNQYDTESKVLDAQIQEARDTRQYELESKLIAQRIANDIELEGIRAANDIALAQERGLQDRTTLEARGTDATVEGPTYDDKTINTALGNAINRAKATMVTTDQFGRTTGKYTPSDEANTVKAWIVSNADDLSPEQGERLIREYNLDRDEIIRMLQGGISPGGK